MFKDLYYQCQKALGASDEDIKYAERHREVLPVNGNTTLETMCLINEVSAAMNISVGGMPIYHSFEGDHFMTLFWIFPEDDKLEKTLKRYKNGEALVFFLDEDPNKSYFKHIKIELDDNGIFTGKFEEPDRELTESEKEMTFKFRCGRYLILKKLKASSEYEHDWLYDQLWKLLQDAVDDGEFYITDDGCVLAKNALS